METCKATSSAGNVRYQLITHKMLSFAHRSAEKKKLANWETAEVAAKLPVGTWEAGKEHSQRHFVQLNREPLSTGERVRVGLGVIVEHFLNKHDPPKRPLSNMDLLVLGRSSLLSCCDRGKEHNLGMEHMLWKHEEWLASLGHRYRHTLQCII